MRRRAIVLTLVVVAAFLGITAAPATAGEPAVVSGTFECTEPGVFTVTWTIENRAGADGEVTDATLSGAASGDITGSFDPNPFTFDDDTIVGSSEVSGDTVGTVTLDATVEFDFKGPFEVDVSADVDLDGSCEAPPETDPSTTEAPTTSEQADVTTRPSFTG
jgi:hypothetical protein